MDITFYHRVDGAIQKKYYVVGPDRVLQEDPGTADSPRLPPFVFGPRGPTALNLNPFLVILNVDIKFRRYIRKGHHTSLSPDIQQLMQKTCQLVQLIYWQPTEATDERGQQRRITVDCMDVDSSISSSDSANMSKFGSLDNKDPGGSIARPRKRWHVDLAERRDYMQYLLSGHGSHVTSSSISLAHSPHSRFAVYQTRPQSPSRVRHAWCVLEQSSLSCPSLVFQRNFLSAM